MPSSEEQGESISTFSIYWCYFYYVYVQDDSVSDFFTWQLSARGLSLIVLMGLQKDHEYAGASLGAHGVTQGISHVFPKNKDSKPSIPSEMLTPETSNQAFHNSKYNVWFRQGNNSILHPAPHFPHSTHSLFRKCKLYCILTQFDTHLQCSCLRFLASCVALWHVHLTGGVMVPAAKILWKQSGWWLAKWWKRACIDISCIIMYM